MAAASWFESLLGDVNGLCGRATTSPDPARTWGEPFVVAHDQLRFNLVDGVHSDPHNNQERSSPKEERNAQPIQEPPREMSINEVAYQRQTLKLDPRNHDHRDQRENRKVESSNDRDLR